jgi:hypothetical protein
MKRHKYFIRFLVFWHIFISAFYLLLFFVRLENYEGVTVSFNGEQLIITSIALSQKIEWYSFNGYMLIIVAFALISGICLLVKKTWGRVLSIVLGAILIPFGIYLFINNFTFTLTRNPTFLEKIEEYFLTIGASASYIELAAIFYGIFAIIYFMRKNVKKYITLQSGKKENGNENRQIHGGGGVQAAAG